MRQRYHTIIKPSPNGWFVGWVEEVPGTITHGRSLDECRANLKDSLELMVETNRDSARVGLDPTCILESIEIDLADTTMAPVMSPSSRANTSAYVH
jgi:predicted RNase H-like HicB family nuclease